MRKTQWWAPTKGFEKEVGKEVGRGVSIEADLKGGRGKYVR